MANATSFGKQASVYASGRPGYPAELYRWISENCQKHECVWDAGTGSGQAARSLTEYFDHVHATDISDAYTAEAVNCPYPTRPVPKLDAGGSWTGQRLVNFVESWSAHYRARQDGLDKSLIELSQNFLDKYADKKLTISLPISLLAATISK